MYVPVVIQSLNHIWLFVIPWTAARQASLSLTISQTLPKFMSIELPSNHLILCCSLLWPSIFPSIRVFSNESALYIRWPKFWSFSSVTQSCPTLQPHEPQHARPPCPSPTPGVHPNLCLLCQWCHPTISSSAVPFSSHLQSFPASGSFQMSQPSASGGQSIGVSASTSVLPMITQDQSPLEWTGWFCL